jgi:hypothetical protein
MVARFGRPVWIRGERDATLAGILVLSASPALGARRWRSRQWRDRRRLLTFWRVPDARLVRTRSRADGHDRSGTWSISRTCRPATVWRKRFPRRAARVEVGPGSRAPASPQGVRRTPAQPPDAAAGALAAEAAGLPHRGGQWPPTLRLAMDDPRHTRGGGRRLLGHTARTCRGLHARSPASPRAGKSCPPVRGHQREPSTRRGRRLRRHQSDTTWAMRIGDRPPANDRGRTRARALRFPRIGAAPVRSAWTARAAGMAARCRAGAARRRPRRIEAARGSPGRPPTVEGARTARRSLDVTRWRVRARRRFSRLEQGEPLAGGPGSRAMREGAGSWLSAHGSPIDLASRGSRRCQ